MQQYKASWHNVCHNKDLTEDERTHLLGSPEETNKVIWRETQKITKAEVNKYVTASSNININKSKDASFISLLKYNSTLPRMNHISYTSATITEFVVKNSLKKVVFLKRI